VHAIYSAVSPEVEDYEPAAKIGKGHISIGVEPLKPRRKFRGVNGPFVSA